MKNHIASLRRWLAFLFAGVVVLLASVSIARVMWLYLAGAVALILGVTDYGRRCPLLLSVRYLYARTRKRTELNKSRQLQILPSTDELTKRKRHAR